MKKPKVLPDAASSSMGATSVYSLPPGISLSLEESIPIRTGSDLYHDWILAVFRKIVENSQIRAKLDLRRN